MLGRGKSAAIRPFGPTLYSSVWTPSTLTLYDNDPHNSQEKTFPPVTMKCANLRPPYPESMRPRPPLPATYQPSPFIFDYAAPAASASLSGSPFLNPPKNIIDKSDIVLCFFDPITSPCKAALVYSDTIHPFHFCGDHADDMIDFDD